jgi:hypothetical protein
MAGRTASLVLAATLLASPAASAQSRPSLIYALPPDGTYAVYQLAGKGQADKPLGGTLRIASVGTKQVGGQPYRWIEVRFETKVGNRSEVRLGKFLIAERAFASGQSLHGNIAEGYVRSSEGLPVRLQPRQVEEFLGLGRANNELKVVEENSAVTTGDGEKRPCRKVEATIRTGDAEVRYTGWLTPSVPFGWARLNTAATAGKTDLGQFTATFTQQGKGAKSELVTD